MANQTFQRIIEFEKRIGDMLRELQARCVNNDHIKPTINLVEECEALQQCLEVVQGPLKRAAEIQISESTSLHKSKLIRPAGRCSRQGESVTEYSNDAFTTPAKQMAQLLLESQKQANDLIAKLETKMEIHKCKDREERLLEERLLEERLLEEHLLEEHLLEERLLEERLLEERLLEERKALQRCLEFVRTASKRVTEIRLENSTLPARSELVESAAEGQQQGRGLTGEPKNWIDTITESKGSQAMSRRPPERFIFDTARGEQLFADGDFEDSTWEHI